LRGRSLGGQPGFNVLTPLVLAAASGGGQESAPRAMLVERGWVPYDHDEVPVVDALPPSGTVEVAGRLRAPDSRPEGTGGRFSPRDPATGRLTQTYYVDVERLARQMPFELVGAYLQQTASSPA